MLLAADVAVAGALVWLAWRVPRRHQRVALGAAAIVLILAAVPPMHHWSHDSVTGHMVQHLLLVVVAPPLVAAGLVGAARFVRPELRRRLRSRAALGTAAGLHVATLAFWHVPGPYDAALASAWVHAVEHATLLGPAVWWWMAITAVSPRRDPFGVVLSLFAVATTGAVVGTLLMFAGPVYAHGTPTDHHVAGAVMAGTGAVYGVAGLGLTARAIARLEEPRRRRIAARSAMVSLVVLLGAGGVAGLTGWVRPPAVAAQPEARVAGGQDEGGDGEVDGRLLYLRDCASCHGPSGEGSYRGIDITERGPASVYYSLATGRMPIVEPDDAVNRSEPSYTPAEIEAIVDHTREFVSGPDVPAPSSSVGVAEGGVLYRLHCAACHSATGIGGAMAFGREAPPVLHSSPSEVMAAMAVGPGNMPSFRGTFDDAELAGVAEYVELLQDPPTRGVPIPGGRVGEGLVAWLVGVGVLALAVVWTGDSPREPGEEGQ